MSAKKSKKSARNDPAPASSATRAPNPASAVAGVTSNAGVAVADAGTSWIDSTDPRKRMWGKLVLVAVWIYVAALWLLALDQTFHWGIFGPVVPPVP